MPQEQMQTERSLLNDRRGPMPQVPMQHKAPVAEGEAAVAEHGAEPRDAWEVEELMGLEMLACPLANGLGEADHARVETVRLGCEPHVHSEAEERAGQTTQRWKEASWPTTLQEHAGRITDPWLTETTTVHQTWTLSSHLQPYGREWRL